MSGIPMHPDTEKLCYDKVNNYLIQMDSLWHVMIYDELASEFFTRHTVSKQNLGSGDKSI
jgi:hypothetical protein